MMDKGWFRYLLLWPVIGLRYLLLERWQPPGGFTPVACSLDGRIPFWEGFIVPYFLWHVCIVGMQLWLCCRDEGVLRQYTRYLAVTLSLSTAAFLLWPTCQELRPAAFPRENLLTRAVAALYRLDTNTNVCPSEHVIGAVGFFLAAAHCERLKAPGKLTALGLLAFLMAASTVFLKQHSLVDVLAALPVCLAGYLISFFPGFSFKAGQHPLFRPLLCTDSLPEGNNSENHP